MCGTYSNNLSCVASDGGDYNVQIIWDIFGTDVGTFTRTYKLYSPLDVACAGTLAGRYTIQGTYALHGLSTCVGACSVLVSAL